MTICVPATKITLPKSNITRKNNVKIEFKTINELYDFIEETAESRKKSYENNELISDALKIDYDEQFGIPKVIDEVFFPKKNAIKDCATVFRTTRYALKEAVFKKRAIKEGEARAIKGSVASKVNEECRVLTERKTAPSV